jgi:hypothetical protein
MNKNLETALAWHSLGIGCIPCLYRSKRPALESWREFQTTLPRKSQLEAWFSNPLYNLAIVCGHKNLVVIDFDCEIAFHKWWNSLNGETAYIVEWTYKVKTPRGWHFYLYVNEMPESVKLDKVDIKAQGTYVLAPPSIHPCGEAYIDATPQYKYSSKRQVNKVNSITDILPDYEKTLEQQRAKMQPKSYDPYADAMRPWQPGNGASIEAIKAKWSITEILGVIDKGQTRIWHTICPLHNDENPSLAIYPDGRWWCFAEARGGDVIDLFAALNHISVQEAIIEMRKEIVEKEK